MTHTLVDMNDNIDGYFPGCMLIGVNDTIHSIIPLEHWPELLAWHSNVGSRPIQVIDQYGHWCSIDRGAVVQVAKRDMNVCAVLAEKARADKAKQLFEAGP